MTYLKINGDFKMTTIFEPLHPGEIIKEILCDGAGLSVTEAAEKLKVDRSTLSRLLNGRSGVSADMAYRLSLLLNSKPELWLNLQRDYDVFHARHRNKNLRIKAVAA